MQDHQPFPAGGLFGLSPHFRYLVSTSTNHLPIRDKIHGSERSKNRHRSCAFTPAPARPAILYGQAHAVQQDAV